MAVEMPRSANRHPLPELLFVPSTLDELAELRQALMAAGHSRAKVAGCVDFVMGRSCGDDMTTGSARAEYRRMLTALVEAHNVHSLALAAA